MRSSGLSSQGCPRRRWRGPLFRGSDGRLVCPRPSLASARPADARLLLLHLIPETLARPFMGFVFPLPDAKGFVLALQLLQHFSVIFARLGVRSEPAYAQDRARNQACEQTPVRPVPATRCKV